MEYFETYEDPDLEDLKSHVFWANRAYHDLMHNPDCKDPDHPGCELCEGQDD